MPKNMNRYRGMYEKGRKQVDLSTPLPWYVGRAHEDRASQFMPFAALKGYDSLIGQADHLVEPRAFLTEEQAEALNQRISGLSRGDVVSLTVYEESVGSTGVTGVVTDLACELGWIEVAHARISLSDIEDLEARTSE